MLEVHTFAFKLGLSVAGVAVLDVVVVAPLAATLGSISTVVGSGGWGTHPARAAGHHVDAQTLQKNRFAVRKC